MTIIDIGIAVWAMCSLLLLYDHLTASSIAKKHPEYNFFIILVIILWPFWLLITLACWIADSLINWWKGY